MRPPRDVTHEFWLVWNPAGSAPRYQHLTFDMAQQEAKRLAEKCPGQRFYVLQPVSVAQRAEPVTVTMLRADLDSEIPF